MGAIDTLKSLLHNVLSDKRVKIPVSINEMNETTKNIIRIFYTGDNDWVSAIQSNAPYYRNRVQVTIRHEVYDMARSLSFDALELINGNRKTIAGLYIIPQSTPVYLGVDDKVGGYVWGFFVDLKGAE